MIKLTIEVKDGVGLNEISGEMVTLGDTKALCYAVGMSLGLYLGRIPHEAAMKGTEALMNGLEQAKKDLETTK